ncbi:MAG: phosphatase PAP2 family protein [Desulfobacula sp.]|nr:phosphatase PAP2 family protein [Desulfobacula sp.]
MLKKIIVAGALISLLFTLNSSFAAADEIETAGDILQIAIPAVAYGTTFFLKDKTGRTQFYKHFLTTVVTTHALKFAIDKKRPEGGGSDSFPSGHTSAAFQGATFIHKRYGWKYSIPAYAGAAFVGYSRIYSDNHYIEDVLAGAALGIISGYIFVTPMNDITVSPIAGNGTYGLMISKSW